MVLNERIFWSGLPRLDINTLTNTTAGFTAFDPNTIDKITKRNCSATFTDGYGSNFFPGGFTTNITIKGRGNVTWNLPKKPYNITLCGVSNFTKRNVRMFNMSTDSDWTLLADYEDYTFSRPMLSTAIAFCFGQWASRMIKIEVYFNGAYQGLYSFCEKVGRSAERINITKLNPTDITSPAITGGYVIEGTKNDYIAANEIWFYDDRFSVAYSYKIPDADTVVAAQNNYAKSVMDDFQTRLYTQPFSDLTNGYRAVIDAPSFAKYYLIQDIIKNADSLSFYMTKDRSAVLKGGPFWDAGLAFGIQEEAPFGAADDTFYYTNRAFYAKLLEDPYFQELLKTEFAAAFTKLHQAIADMRDFGALLRSSATATEGKDAVQRDLERWPEARRFPGQYDRNFPRLIKFMKDRMFWQYRRWYVPLTAHSATVNI